MANILASSIKNKTHLATFDAMVEQRFADIDFSPVLMNLVDTCASNALPYLLNQFDVLGYKGLRFATTESEQRELLKKSIELHRYKGTPWSIKEALKLIGINAVEIIKVTTSMYYDGFSYYNCTNGYVAINWANFSLKVSTTVFASIDTQIKNDIIALVSEYKNERSKFVSIVTDSNTYNGAITYNGAENYIVPTIFI